MPPFNIQQILIALAVGTILGFASAWVVQGWRMDAVRADYETDKAKAVQEEFDRANQISNDYAQVVRWLNEQRSKRAVTVATELQKPEYRSLDCVLPESGRMLINDAVRQANAARLPGTTLPEVTRNAAEPAADGSGGLGTSGSGFLRGLRLKQSGADPVGH